MTKKPTFSINDPITFRRHMGAHRERGLVKGRTFESQPRYEVETPEGERLFDAVDITLDEETMAAIRDRELADMEARP